MLSLGIGISAGSTGVGGASYGAELVSNGNFASDTIWTKGIGWVIAAGVASSADSTAITQAITLTAGSVYEITYTITARTSGTAQIQLTGGTTVNGLVRSSTGTFTEQLIAVSGNTTIGIIGNIFIGSIDNVTAKQVTILH